jgi:two-component system, sporulation sensor kinase E
VPIGVSDIKLAGLCSLIAGNIIYTTTLHRKLIDAEKMAAMGELAMFVTHQLRNPLVTIGGFTDQLIRPDVTEEKRDRNLRIIREEIQRLENIVYQMGHFLKVSMKEPVFFDPAPAIQSVLKSPEIVAKGRAYSFDVEVDEDPPLIFCDPTSFGEVFRNLLDNAFDATPAGGTITVRGHRKGKDRYLVSVRDTGQGVSNPDKAQLFRPFFTTKEKGMGLGLPFTKRVMDSCGGAIEVQSRLGRGALFKLIFQSREREQSQ